MTVFICGGDVAYRRRILACWGACEGRRRRVVVSYAWSPYYSPTFHCCACGDTWSDGELGYRPFRRGWRKGAIAQSKAMWAGATTGPILRDDEGYVVTEPAT